MAALLAEGTSSRLRRQPALPLTLLLMVMSARVAIAAPRHIEGWPGDDRRLATPTAAAASSVIRHSKSSLITSAVAPSPVPPQQQQQQTYLHQQQQHQPPAQHPTSALAKRLIYQSPPQAENIYKEFIVGSKPLLLRSNAYGSSGGPPKRRKKTKKDSKIYYIPIPPMPYRYTPNIGWDYQPMKIKPIMKDTTTTTTTPAAKPAKSMPTTTTTTTTTSSPTTTTTRRPATPPASVGDIDDYASSESRIYQLKPPRPALQYRFNGRPQRLLAAHAHPGRANALGPDNLKAKFYFNKPIIY